MKRRGEERLRGRIVQVTGDALALLRCALALAAPRLGEVERGSSPLADHRGEAHRGQCGDSDVELRAQRAVGDRLRNERAHVASGDPHRQAGSHGYRKRCALLAEPQSGPDQRGEHHVGQRLAARERNGAQRDDSADRQRALPPAPAPPCGRGRPCPRQGQGNHDQRTAGIAQEPAPPEGQALGGSDRASRAHGYQPEGRADRRAGGDGEQQPAELLEPIQCRPGSQELPQQQHDHDDVGHVPDAHQDAAAHRKRGIEQQHIPDRPHRAASAAPPGTEPRRRPPRAARSRLPGRCIGARGRPAPRRSRQQRAAGRRRRTGQPCVLPRPPARWPSPRARTPARP